jgi:hypothetical protein
MPQVVDVACWYKLHRYMSLSGTRHSHMCSCMGGGRRRLGAYRNNYYLPNRRRSASTRARPLVLGPTTRRLLAQAPRALLESRRISSVQQGRQHYGLMQICIRLQLHEKSGDGESHGTFGDHFGAPGGDLSHGWLSHGSDPDVVRIHWDSSSRVHEQNPFTYNMMQTCLGFVHLGMCGLAHLVVLCHCCWHVRQPTDTPHVVQ